MQRMDDARFLAWVTEGGIEDRSRSEANLHLDFPGELRHGRTWPAPDDPDALARWLGAIVRAASPDGPWWVRRRYGPGWWPGEDGAPPSPELERAAAAAGVPRGFAGALRFGADEWDAMAALLESYATWEWGMGEDLFVIPEDRSCIVLLCHDEEAHVNTPTRERLDAFARAVMGGPPPGPA
jgi:hypothetical protein